MVFNNAPFSLNDKSITIPENSLIEKRTLGLMLNDQETCDAALQLLSTDSFPNISNNNRAVFQAIRKLRDENIEVDPLTVFNELKAMKLDTLVGGFEYLRQITDDAFTFSAIKDYCKQLEDLTLMRNTLKVLDERISIYKKGMNLDINDYIGDLNREITAVAEKRRILDFESMKTIAGELSQHLKTMRKSGTGNITGSNTLYSELNKYTNGFQKGDYIIIAARPSVGKTAFGLNLAYNIAAATKNTVGFFSLEMGAQQLMMRLVASKSQVYHEKIRTNTMSSSEKSNVEEALSFFATIPLYIDETAGITINDLMIKTRKLKREHDDLAVIFIDYIGLVTTTGRFENRQQQISEISRSLKELARELNITVVALSQLSREVEKRPDKRPILADLRESGSLEQDADVVMLMYREDYYIELKTIAMKNAVYRAYYDGLNETDNKLSPSLVDISIAKNRNGKTANMVLLFFKSIGKFEDLDTRTFSFVKEMQKQHHQIKVD